jgi:voltage-gated potassium channel
MNSKFRKQLHEIIFEADTKAGRYFDIMLIALIVLSVITIMTESVPALRARWGKELYLIEWGFTIIFTVEYLIRIYVVRVKRIYLFSFYGIIDFLAILPTYLNLLMPGMHYLLMVRLIRVLRIFRILKVVKYINEASYLRYALIASRRKIAVFLFVVLVLVVISGSLMYVVEGESNGFTSIPKSIYWAIVTLTTVGYGDISPQTPLGQMISIVIMLMGYSIIAVPTGIVTVELNRVKTISNTQVCEICGFSRHDDDALFCKKCGEKLS